MKKITLARLITAFSLVLSLSAVSQTETWTQIPSGTTSDLIGVSVISRDTCYVSGFNGKVMKTTNGGVNWTTQTTPTVQNLYGLDFINSSIGFAVGDNGAIIKTINGGANWTSVSLTTTHLRSVKFIDNLTGFITGGNGLILKTINGGSTWNTMPTGSSSAIYGVCFINSLTGFASCFSGEVLKTTNGGSTWTITTTGVTSQITTIRFTSAINGTFIGANGVIRKTTDGGNTWTPVSVSPISDLLYCHSFLDANNGFITGGHITNNTGVILKTIDGGASWTASFPGTPRLLNHEFANANVGYAVGLGGTIMKYSSNVGIVEHHEITELLSAYPNPTNSFTSIDLRKFKINCPVSLELFDVAGKLIKKLDFETSDIINISKGDLKAGLYFFNVITKENLLGKGKIVIE